MTTSKTGKHGHAKCHFTALDIFTAKKMEMLESSSHNVEIPNVTRYEYSLLDIDEDFVSLMDESGETRDDLKMPENDDDLAAKIRKDFDDGTCACVCVYVPSCSFFFFSFFFSASLYTSYSADGIRRCSGEGTLCLHHSRSHEEENQRCVCPAPLIAVIYMCVCVLTD